MTTASHAQAEGQASREPPQDQAAEQQDAMQQILAMVSRLPENQREVIRLKFQNGMSYREISDVTELSLSNVGYLLHTALSRLRKELADCG